VKPISGRFSSIPSFNPEMNFPIYLGTVVNFPQFRLQVEIPPKTSAPLDNFSNLPENRGTSARLFYPDTS